MSCGSNCNSCASNCIIQRANLEGVDTSTVDITIDQTGSPIQVSADVIIDPDTTNVLTDTGNGLAVLCEDIQDCVGAMVANVFDGLVYDDAGNAMIAAISTDAGNTMTYGSDGGLNVTGVPETDLVVTTDGNATGVGQSGTADHTADITLLSGDAGQILVSGTDGGLLLDCVAVNACVTIPAETDLVVTTDGNATGVAQSGTADHTTDITLLSTDADNIITSGIDGGLWLDCVTVASCVSADAGNVITQGSDGLLFAPTSGGSSFTAVDACTLRHDDGLGNTTDIPNRTDPDIGTYPGTDIACADVVYCDDGALKTVNDSFQRGRAIAGGATISMSALGAANTVITGLATSTIVNPTDQVLSTIVGVAVYHAEIRTNGEDRLIVESQWQLDGGGFNPGAHAQVGFFAGNNSYRNDQSGIWRFFQVNIAAKATAVLETRLVARTINVDVNTSEIVSPVVGHIIFGGTN